MDLSPYVINNTLPAVYCTHKYFCCIDTEVVMMFNRVEMSLDEHSIGQLQLVFRTHGTFIEGTSVDEVHA